MKAPILVFLFVYFPIWSAGLWCHCLPRFAPEIVVTPLKRPQPWNCRDVNSNHFGHFQGPQTYRTVVECPDAIEEIDISDHATARFPEDMVEMNEPSKCVTPNQVLPTAAKRRGYEPLITQFENWATPKRRIYKPSETTDFTQFGIEVALYGSAF